MKRRLPEEQIIGLPKTAAAVGNVREVCHQQIINEQTFCRWRNRYGGMEASDV